MKELEVLNLDGLDFEEIERNLGGYPFPAVTTTNEYFYINMAFANILDAENAKYIKFYVTPDYVILSPSSEVVNNSYKICHWIQAGRTAACMTVKIPANMKEKKIATGVYKIYKCKQGYAFKRYEPMAKRNYKS